MEEKFCQCCGMPMGETDELYGTNKDGSKSQDYCEYCIQPMLKANPDLKEEEARAGMMEWFPTLKRWKKVS